MRQKEAEVNVRLKVRPLGSNWRLVKRVQQEDENPKTSESEPALDCTVWKTDNYRNEPMESPSPTVSESYSHPKSKLPGPGVIRKCDCPTCFLLDDTETSVEMQPMKITRIECEPAPVKRRKPKPKKCPPPVPRSRRQPPPTATQVTYEEPLQLKPAVLQSEKILPCIPPPAPPPTIVDTPSVEVALVSSSTVIKVKSKNCVCSSDSGTVKGQRPAPTIANTDSTRTAIPQSMVEELLENRDIEIENRINAIIAQSSCIESTPFSMKKIFYDSESNMWLLIALIVLSILAYRSSMDTHMCYYD